jgi:hypothetical protein
MICPFKPEEDNDCATDCIFSIGVDKCKIAQACQDIQQTKALVRQISEALDER